MAFEQWPYTNLHDLNLDWILEKVKEFDKKLESFELYYPHISDKNEGAWSSIYNYNPNELVLYNNALYIALKAVPAGVAITNNEYWMKIADVNVDVLELQEQMDTLRQDVQQDIADEREYVETAIEQVMTSVGPTQRNIIMIFDSFGMETNNGGTLNPSMPQYVANALGWGSDRIHSSALSGAGFCNGKYQQQLDSFVNSMSAELKALITDVYVLGGYNDHTGVSGVSEAVFNNAASMFASSVRTNYPNAALHVGFMAWRKEAYPTNLANTRTWYINLAKYGYDVMYNLQWFLHNPDYYGADYIHPGQTGSNAIAQCLIDYILSGEGHCHWTRRIPFAAFSSASGFNAPTSRFQFRMEVECWDEQTTINILCGQGGLPVQAINANTGEQEARTIVTRDTEHHIIDIATDYAVKGLYDYCAVPTILTYFQEDGTQISAWGRYVFRGTEIYIRSGAILTQFDQSAYNQPYRSIAAIGIMLPVSSATVMTLYV